MTSQTEHIVQTLVTMGTPTYAYSEKTIVRNVERIQEAAKTHGLAERTELFVPYFTNSHPSLFRIFQKLGVGATIQNVEENEQLGSAGLELPRIVSPTHLSDLHFEYFSTRGLPLNLATLGNLERAVYCNTPELRLRLDLSAEANQRHGIKPAEYPDVRRILGKRELTGIHVYPGTGSDLEACLRFQRRALEVLNEFPSVRELNLGGGFQFDYAEVDNERQHFAWNHYFGRLKERVTSCSIREDVNFILEPGRDLLADAGFLLLRVTGIEKPQGRNVCQVHTDGSYTLMPSAQIRERQHHLSFYDLGFNELKEEDQNGLPAMLNGSTTLSSDHPLPGIVYIPPSLKVGDYVVIQDVGAYAATQHLEFLNKAPAAEVLFGLDGKTSLITRRGSLTDRLRNASYFQRQQPI